VWHYAREITDNIDQLLTSRHNYLRIVDSSALAVGGFERHRPDNVSQRAAGKIDDLKVDIVDVVLRVLDARLVRFDFVINLRINHGVEVIIGDDFLRLSIDQLFRDIYRVQLANNGGDSMKTRIGEMMIFPQALDKGSACRPDDSYPRQEEESNDPSKNLEPDSNITLHNTSPCSNEHVQLLQ
jgi:hypothetical protein